MSKAKDSKRILKVTVRRMVDDSPDTSYLGEYSDTAETEFAIERRAYGQGNQREFRYFNPQTVEPFKADAAWIPAHIQNKEAYWRRAMKKNAQRDYERTESLHAGNWCYIGIRAEARVLLSANTSMSPKERAATCSHVTQTITSGGLWGIESDSDKSYFAEVEAEELSGLRTELTALGFSRRAIAKAFKDVEHREE